MSNEVQALSKTVIEVKRALSREDVMSRLTKMTNNNAEAFVTSILQTVRGNEQLMTCTPESIISAAMVAAALNLPVDPNLGLAAIVPYGKEAQFQIMWKGVVQLSIRTAQYKNMNVTEIYEDELVDYDPFSGEVVFQRGTMRQQGGKVVGYYAVFKLLTGFEKSLFMSAEEVDAHAKRYSKAYQRDLKYGTKKSLWSTDFDKMGMKTVIKLLLSKFGLMSIEMQTAQRFDQAVVRGTLDDPQPVYLDNPESGDVQDVDIIANPFSQPAEGQVVLDDDLAGTPFDPDFKG